MESHQRYFPLGGNRFAFVANGGDPRPRGAGNESVLEGRLEDASFTFERDVAKGIERAGARSRRASRSSPAPAPSADKVARLEALVEALGGGDASREAARLAKADQAAELVREFPDLEGHIGAEYARLAGFPRRSAPRSTSSTSRTRPAARCPRPRPAASSPPRTRSTTSPWPSRSASGRPARAIRTVFGARRSASAGSRSRRTSSSTLPALVGDARTSCSSTRAPSEGRPERGRATSSRSGWRACSTSRSSSSAPRARAGSPSSARSRASPQTLAAAADTEEFERAYVAYDRANSLAGKADGAAHRARPEARDRRGRDRARSRRSPASRRRSGRRSRPATSRQHWQPRPSFALPSTASSTRCSSWPRTRRCARTGFASFSTCATPSARSATSRRSRGERAARDPRHLRLDRGDGGALRRGGRAAVSGRGVRDRPAPEDHERRRRPARGGPRAGTESGHHVHARRAASSGTRCGRSAGATASTTATSSAIRSTRSRGCRGQPATMTPGAQPVLDSSYFKRIAAIEFAVRFDDGVGDARAQGRGHRARRRVAELEDAALDLSGLPRLQDRQRADRSGRRAAEGALRDRPGQDRRADHRRPGLAEIRSERARGMRGAKRRMRIRRDLRGARGARRRAPAAGLPGDRGLRPGDRGDRPPHHPLVEQRRLEAEAKT